VKPIAGTNSCEVHHNGYVESGRMHIVMDDGSEFDMGPGDVFVCPPGHDAWTVGNEPCIAFRLLVGHPALREVVASEYRGRLPAGCELISPR
jgi:hypothetical protein